MITLLSVLYTDIIVTKIVKEITAERFTDMAMQEEMCSCFQTVSST